MRQRRDEQRDDHYREGESEDEPLERIREHEIADVAVKLRVLDAEALTVDPQQIRAPASGGRQTRKQARNHADSGENPGVEWLDDDPVTLEVLLLERHRTNGR